MGHAGPRAVQGKRKKDNGDQKHDSTKPQKKQTTIEEILKDAKKVNFNDGPACEKFRATYLNRLSKRPNSQGSHPSRSSRTPISASNQADEILHVVARKPNDEFAELESFTRWAVKNYSNLLEFKSSYGVTPLHLAIENDSHVFVEVVLLALCESDKMRVKELLQEACHLDNNCLQKAIHHSSPLTESIISILADESGHGDAEFTTTDNSDSESGAEVPITQPLPQEYRNVFTSKSCNKHQGQGGWTALHFAVRYEDGDGDSDQDSASDSEEDASCFPCISETYVIFDSDPSGPGSSTRTYETSTRVHEQREQDEKYQWQRTYNQLRVVQQLIEANPMVLLYKDDKGHTPFQLRLSQIEDRDSEAIIDVDDDQSLHNDSEEEYTATISSWQTRTSYLGGQRQQDQHNSGASTTIAPLAPTQSQESQNFQADADTLATEDQQLKRKHQVEVQIINEDKILSYIREYVIDKFDRRTAMQALYKPGFGMYFYPLSWEWAVLDR